MKAILISIMAMISIAAQAADIEIKNPRIFAPIEGTNTTAGYGTIKNTSKKEVIIKAVEVQPFKAIELHQTSEKDGRMSMQKMEEIKIPAGKEFDLAPGGNHIMLFDATKAVKEKETLTVKLTVNGKEQTFQFPVVARIQKQEEHHHHH
ncbi:MAG: copper chaperone PCu(A)C [Bdellovibrio sp.]|nr:copper chaperone PCu(A)C [Bdellovibrio sp.]